MQICKFDDVYDYICWRLKLEGETENTGVLFFDDDVNLLAHFFLRGSQEERETLKEEAEPSAGTTGTKKAAGRKDREGNWQI